MADVINPIIRQGGTTAFQSEMTATDIAALTLERPEMISVLVALDGDGVVAGFQYLTRLEGAAIGDIASFTRRAPALKGAGRALMAGTKVAGIAAGLTAINAVIRADNVPGLGYYSAMGFEDIDVIKAVPLADGTQVDRLVKRLSLKKV